MDSDQGCPLAVAVPMIGQRSETFVRSHTNSVLPGRTASVGEQLADPTSWKPDGPTLTLLPQKANVNLAHGLWRLGIVPAKKLVNFLKDNGVQVLLVEYLHSMLPLMSHVQDSGIKWFSFGHGYDVSSLLKNPTWAARLQAQKRADGVFVRAEAIRQRMIAFGIDPAKVHTVLSSAAVPSKPTEHAPTENFRLVAVGRMVAKKGPLQTIEAFRIALQSASYLELHYIGEGPLFEQAKTYVEKHGLAEKVILYGGKPHDFVLSLMERSDAYIQHSMVDPKTGDEEGMPASILEAMGRCLPIVTTLHAGIPEAVSHMGEGLLSAEGDSEAMAQNIVQLVSSAELTNLLGLRAWEKACNTFTWERERSDILRLTGLERYA